MELVIVCLAMCAIVHAYRVRRQRRQLAPGFVLSFYGLPVDDDTLDSVARAVNAMGFEFRFSEDHRLITLAYMSAQETYATEIKSERPTDHVLAGTLLVTLRMFAAQHQEFGNLKEYPFLWRG